ncbi:alcohol dehydrogenase catalytic domain-containing protein [Nonomuraea sp. NPDC049152]|uniref:zinc-dependent alcohol dehydrogenase n=1 Tax=Nonomuraea sp. NPDC049152 TaxID=3154350 RepID=UPI003403C090
MRAFALLGPREAVVEEVEPPVAGPGQVVVDVERVGLCGTDLEFYTGEMAYLKQGHAGYPIRLGHEWCGRVASAGEGVDTAWLGRRVAGDTMLGCGRCARCMGGRHHVCEDRFEVGIRGGWPGALAEQLLMPATALLALPDEVGPTAGALVEPGGNALRAARATGARAGMRVLVWGPGTIGRLAAAFARAAGAEVHLVGLEAGEGVWSAEELPGLPYDAIIDATNAAAVPQAALDLVEPGGRVVYIGLAATPSTIDTRRLVLKDVTAVGVLGGSQGLRAAVEHYSSGAVDPEPLVAATVPLEQAGEVLAGWRPPDAGPGPKIHINPALGR